VSCAHVLAVISPVLGTRFACVVRVGGGGRGGGVDAGVGHDVSELCCAHVFLW